MKRILMLAVFLLVPAAVAQNANTDCLLMGNIVSCTTQTHPVQPTSDYDFPVRMLMQRNEMLRQRTESNSIAASSAQNEHTETVDPASVLSQEIVNAPDVGTGYLRAADKLSAIATIRRDPQLARTAASIRQQGEAIRLEQEAQEEKQLLQTAHDQRSAQKTSHQNSTEPSSVDQDQLTPQQRRERLLRQ